MHSRQDVSSAPNFRSQYLGQDFSVCKSSRRGSYLFILILDLVIQGLGLIFLVHPSSCGGSFPHLSARYFLHHCHDSEVLIWRLITCVVPQSIPARRSSHPRTNFISDRLRGHSFADVIKLEAVFFETFV